MEEITSKSSENIEISELSELIEMAWSDKVSFDVILLNTGLSEKEVKARMRRFLKPKSYKLWRRRVVGRRSKHGRK